MAINFQQIQVDDINLNRIQANISTSFNSISGPFLGGNFLTGVSLQGGSVTVVNHGLGRIPQLFVLCDQNTNTNVWRSSWDSNSISLNCGSNCIVSLWVN